MSLVRRVIGSLDALFGEAGLFLQRQRDAGAILLYHRIGPFDDSAYPPLAAELFDQHCAVIRGHFAVVTLREFIRRLREGRSLRRCCAITFDDGYRDFREHACPVLSRHGLPATHFLVSDSVRSGRPDWTFRLARILEALPAGAIEDPLQSVQFDRRTITSELAGLSASAREEWLDAWERRLPSGTPSEPAMLSAEDLPACVPGLVEWGSHTVSHAMLGRCSADAMRHELSTSREQLSEWTGVPIDFVSYPSNSYDALVMTIAKQSGYQAGLAVDQRETKPDAPLFALPRFDIGAMPPSMLRLEVGGAVEPLRRLRARSFRWHA